MAELEIPERALRAACDAYDAALDREFREYGEVQHEGPDHAELAAVRAAAPITVAAELRRLAERTNVSTQIWLRQRADELDPTGDNQ